MARNEEAARQLRQQRARQGSHRTRSIVSDYEQACLAAGLLIAVSFGLMFVIGAVMF